ncbi:MAG: YitT family protein [Pseudomonadota bacterium]
MARPRTLLRPSWFGDWSARADHHAPYEDVQGIVISLVVVALAVAILAEIRLMTSGIAGAALILHHATGVSVGLGFFLLNLPFYILALVQMGWGFTLKTFASVSLLSVAVDLQARFYGFSFIDPFYGAVLAGVLLGFGLLGMFRHRATLGGVGILAIALQERFGTRAGLTLLAFDVVLFALALIWMPPMTVALSLLGAIVLNIILTVNHRPDRYIAR